MKFTNTIMGSTPGTTMPVLSAAMLQRGKFNPIIEMISISTLRPST
jgi:hypothetical protein